MANDLPTRAHSLKTGASATNFPGQDAVQTPTRHRYQSSTFLPEVAGDSRARKCVCKWIAPWRTSKLSPLPVFVSNSSCSVAPTRLLQNTSSSFYLPFVGMADELSNALGLAGDERHSPQKIIQKEAISAELDACASKRLDAISNQATLCVFTPCPMRNKCNK